MIEVHVRTGSTFKPQTSSSSLKPHPLKLRLSRVLVGTCISCISCISCIFMCILPVPTKAPSSPFLFPPRSPSSPLPLSQLHRCKTRFARTQYPGIQASSHAHIASDPIVTRLQQKIKRRSFRKYIEYMYMYMYIYTYIHIYIQHHTSPPFQRNPSSCRSPHPRPHPPSKF